MNERTGQRQKEREKNKFIDKEEMGLHVYNTKNYATEMFFPSSLSIFFSLFRLEKRKWKTVKMKNELIARHAQIESNRNYIKYLFYEFLISPDSFFLRNIFLDTDGPFRTTYDTALSVWSSPGVFRNHLAWPFSG